MLHAMLVVRPAAVAVMVVSLLALAPGRLNGQEDSGKDLNACKDHGEMIGMQVGEEACSIVKTTCTLWPFTGRETPVLAPSGDVLQVHQLEQMNKTVKC